ncbi:MAG: replicative DNA helicase [Clostridia bacterium]|nr:replicative DNA helicase [Clostridia bacterium]
MEAEQSVLGSILMQPDCINQVMDILNANHFYLPEHQAIFHAMVSKSLASQVIDVVTVLEELKAEGFFSTQSGKEYLFKLAQIVPSITNIRTYATIVKEKYEHRQLILALQELKEEAMDPTVQPSVLLDAAEQKIYDIRQDRQSGSLRPIAEVIHESFDTFVKLSGPDKEQYLGIPSGIPTLDVLTTGLNRSDLIIVGARPGMGKTSFALNIARNVALMQKRTVIFFNLEMSCEQMVNRLLSAEARVSSKKLRTGEMDKEEWRRLGMAGATLLEAPIFLDDTASITVPEMMSRVRRIKDPGVVIIDYLQLMHSAKKTDNRVQEVSEITRSLKLMAKELKIPVIVCAQLARTTEKQGSNHRPALSDLRESGSIEQDADQVLFLYRDEYYKNSAKDPEAVETGTSEVIVAKNRHGELGTVKLAWSGEFTQFTALDLHHSE